MIRAQVIGSGACSPERVVTNAFFENLVENADEWIFSRTGIRERRFAREDQATSDLATIAAQEALKSAGISAEEIDCIVLGTSTPDMCLPATACIVQKNIGAKNAFAFDINAVCSSFVYAMEVADNFITCGKYKTVLAIGADTYSKILDFQDQSTCPLFGDGAGAAVLRATEEADKGVLCTYMRSDGNGWPLIRVPSSGSRKPITAETIALRENTFKMAGKQVYIFATEVIPEIIVELCKKAGITPSDLTYIIPHQANVRMIDFIAKKFGYPKERFLLNLDRCGNTSAASVALVMAENMHNGTIKPGDLVLTMGFGGGLSWGGLLIRF
ncbi:beta-ketoacyl-ACP synthase III [Geobacter sp. SVR]|uniref:beta-ketoacyl-ACP synthase III n=1 Tax=Geobacter sp. SVR TaxID=2495594 RepID=UPI00143EFDD2|nr:beta-ketoacyl-ACP synthase III [Geobacter sp. SVR]BCS52183.1 3-oxoacyl-[acyl-carrier-protein] synthase 3 [Geobacter sp. SVR]GCF85155.1 3-oxoacyl-[acyl-carrier-protein] synthase 3 [Geobacter sp. SVR]